MKRQLSLWLWLIMALCSLPLAAAAPSAPLPPSHLTGFAALPVLHEGRLKPLDTLARLTYRAVTGTAAPRDNTALSWLATTLFTPAAGLQTPQFRIVSSEVAHRLGLTLRPDKLYDFQTLVTAMVTQQTMVNGLLAADRGTLTATDRTLLTLYAAVDDYRQLTGALSLLLPLQLPRANTVRQRLDLPADAPLTIMALWKLKPEITAQLTATLQTKRDDVARYTAAEQDNAELAYQLQSLEAVGNQNSLLRILPPLWAGDEVWRAPWEAAQNGQLSAASKPFLAAWQQAAMAWREGNIGQWHTAITQLNHLTIQAQSPSFRPWALTLEVWLNRLTPFSISLWLMVIGLVIMIPIKKLAMPVLQERAGISCLLIALLTQGLGLLARMLILSRPPVSTLYETTIFVSFIALAAGLLLRWRGQHEGLWVGSIIAIFLLLTSHVFAADGDTLVVLTAVLDTNFWLATHVVCITIGYGATLVAGVMAHLALWRQGRYPHMLHRNEAVHRVALFALLFTTIGTMLGGIWADQSWGRFWGWDPKENGALWIVLWLVWLLHGRIAGQLKPFGFMVGMALSTIVVALAWFGVNLLGIGLHSYGFTNSAAYGLAVFCAAEIIIIAGLAGYYRIRAHRHSSSQTRLSRL